MARIAIPGPDGRLLDKQLPERLAPSKITEGNEAVAGGIAMAEKFGSAFVPAPLDPRSFGARWDGTGDDTDANNACFAAAKAQGRKVALPKGVSKNAGLVVHDGPSVLIEGRGAADSIFERTTAGPVLKLGPGATGSGSRPSGRISDFAVRGLTNAPSDGSAAITLDGLRQASIERVQADRADIGFDLVNNAFGSSFKDIRAGFGGSVNVGINLRDGGNSGNDLTFHDAWIMGKKAAVHASPSGGNFHFFGGQLAAGMTLTAADDLLGTIILGKDYLTGAVGTMGQIDFDGVDFESARYVWQLRAFGQFHLAVRNSLFIANHNPGSAILPAIGIGKFSNPSASFAHFDTNKISGEYSNAAPLVVEGTLSSVARIEERNWGIQTSVKLNGVVPTNPAFIGLGPTSGGIAQAITKSEYRYGGRQIIDLGGQKLTQVGGVWSTSSDYITWTPLAHEYSAPTASLPAASAHKGAVAFDETLNALVYSNGNAWVAVGSGSTGGGTGGGDGTETKTAMTAVTMSPGIAAGAAGEMLYANFFSIPVDTIQWRIVVSNQGVNGNGQDITGANLGIADPVYDANGRHSGIVNSASIAAGVTIPGTTDYVGPWITDAGRQIKAGATKAFTTGAILPAGSNATPSASVIAKLASGAAANYATDSATGWTVAARSFFDIRIEYQYKRAIASGRGKFGVQWGHSVDVVGPGGQPATDLATYPPLAPENTFAAQLAMKAGHTLANLGIAAATLTDFGTLTRRQTRLVGMNNEVEFLILTLGGNDMINNANIATMKSRLKACIDLARTTYPNLKAIYVGNTHPLGGYSAWGNVAVLKEDAANAQSVIVLDKQLPTGAYTLGEGWPSLTATRQATVTVSSVAASTTGGFAHTLSTNLAYPHYAGELIASGKELVRWQWNHWLATLPFGIEGVIDLDNTLKWPERPYRMSYKVDTGDGVHWIPEAHTMIAAQNSIG